MSQFSVRFLLSAAITTALLIGAMTWLLFVNGELHTTSVGTRLQFYSNGTYGRSIWDDFFAHKLALYTLRPTHSISIGSSRAMPVRALLFRNNDHMSAGGAINSVDELEVFVTELAAIEERPTVVFFYVDFTWFIAGTDRIRNAAIRGRYDTYLFLYQSAFVHTGELVRNAFAHRFQVDPETGGALLGARAQRFGDGFRIDGSIRHYSYLNGMRRWPEGDLGSFLETTESPLARDDARAYAARGGWLGASLDDRSFARFEEAVRRLRSLVSSVVVILPPVAPHVALALAHSDELAFFPAWQRRIAEFARQTGMPMFDFTLMPLSSPSCYTDRNHASEGAYAWILRTIRPKLILSSPAAADALDPGALERYGDSECLRALPPIVGVNAPAGR